jgi:hypothetical protein
MAGRPRAGAALTVSVQAATRSLPTAKTVSASPTTLTTAVVSVTPARLLELVSPLAPAPTLVSSHLPCGLDRAERMGSRAHAACQLTCASGYARSTDGKSCTATLTCKDGSYASNGVCARYGCSTNADCQRQTGLTNSACYQSVCFATSSNTAGLPAGSNCGYGGLSPNGDDNSCAAGTVCVNYKCTNPFASDNNK